MLALFSAARSCRNSLSQQVRSLMTYVPRPGDSMVQKVTMIPGDGIGPEVLGSVSEVVKKLNAPIEWDRIQSLSGTEATGEPKDTVPSDVVDSILSNQFCLKGTLFTPLTEHNTNTNSLNVQLRKELDLSVNVVHAFSIPGLKTRHDDLDIVVVRENTEGEYSGLEHEVVEGVVESLKIITAEKSARTARYAFEFAYLNNRRKVTAIHKANIMKQGDGQFLKACREVAEQFPTVQYDEMIIDNTCMQLVSNPSQFDVMVTPNLYGQLVSNVAAGLCGGYGVCPGVNVGENCTIFEQGARYVGREIAGQGIANPTAVLFSTVMMMRSLQLPEFADRLEQAILSVYSKGDMSVITPDVGGSGDTTKFTQAVMSYL